jgi:site-specific recombinase XerD
MLEQVIACPCVRARLRAGPLGALLDDYVTRLHSRGYARHSLSLHVASLGHFGTWLQTQGLELTAVNEEVARSFLHGGHLANCRCPSPAPTDFRQIRPALRHLLLLLRDRRGSGTAGADADAIRTALEAFRTHLRQTCGLAEATARLRVYYARKFLEGKFGRETPRWESLQPADVISFVVAYSKRRQSSSARVVCNALRCFLRYLLLQGWCEPALVAAVPRLPQWQLSRLPRTLTDEQLITFLAAFDRSTAAGRRDYAMALCQVDLGLRAGEVAGLCLEDLDWRSATVRIVAGKAKRVRALPLPARMGEAIAAYLHDGRPKTSCRHVFVRHWAFRGMPLDTTAIQAAMRPAYRKVPGCEHWAGTHALRHTAATRLHRRGAALKEVADFLGHRCLDTTAIYTKVDVARLATVALPWPEAQS